MYFLTKRIEVSFAHKLSLTYGSKCTNLHGHNAIITIYCQAQELDENGMVTDFSHIKKLVQDKLDHQCLNDVFDFNPTAENISRWIADNTPNCYKVTLQESEGNIGGYVKPGFETMR